MKKGNINLDLDLKIIVVKLLCLVVLGGLKIVRGFLEVLKFILGVIGKIVIFIIDKGLDVLVKIYVVEFEGKLDVVKGGSVCLELDIEWRGKWKDMNLNFNFYNLFSILKDFVDRFMKED